MEAQKNPLPNSPGHHQSRPLNHSSHHGSHHSHSPGCHHRHGRSPHSSHSSHHHSRSPFCRHHHSSSPSPHHHRSSCSPHSRHHHHHHFHHDDAMDPNIWQNLPDTILNRVLARLPLISILRYRLVCKNWNSKILSPTLAALRTGLFPHRPGFIRISAQQSNAGHLQLDYLDRHFHWRKICLGVPPGSIEIEAAHSHLLCLSMTFNSLDGFVFKRFLMCNPVTAACKYLPPTLTTSYPIIVGMMVDRCTGDYILVFGGNFKIARGQQQAYRTAEVYKSSKGKWSRVPDMPKNVTPVLTSVTCNKHLYWLAWDDNEHFGLLCFDIEKEAWEWFHTSCDVECYVPWGLMERHGSLYKVGKVSPTINKSFVWELNEETMEWKIMSEVPEDSEMHWEGCVRHCVGHDGAFCSDNSCGLGGLIYKFDEDGGISIYKAPTCPTEEEALAGQGHVLEHQQGTSFEVVKDVVDDDNEGKLHSIDEGEEEDHNVSSLHDVDDAASCTSSMGSESSVSSYSGSDSSDDEELEPDLPNTKNTKLTPLCNPNMVASFGHLYVFEPCLGKV